MRMVRWVFALLFVIVCLGASSATAAQAPSPGPAWSVLPGATYPWVQPVFGPKHIVKMRVAGIGSLQPGPQLVWTQVGGLLLPKLSR